MGPNGEFRHDAFLYANRSEFVDRTGEFIRGAVAAEEPVLVVVGDAKITALRETLGADADHVQFADMRTVGHNPARLIPIWQDFVDTYASTGRRLRGVGEPVWPGRSPDELIECRHHEAFLNLAFADTPGFWLLCPYDTTGLDQAVVEQAHTTHPRIDRAIPSRATGHYEEMVPISLLREPLPDPPDGAAARWFENRSGVLASLRRFAVGHAVAKGYESRAADVELTVGELATNSLVHGRGGGTVRLWEHGGSLIVDVHDDGLLTDPLVGRRRPAANQRGGRGLWMANQVCDLLQVRSSSDRGTTVRAHFFGGRGPSHART